MDRSALGIGAIGCLVTVLAHAPSGEWGNRRTYPVGWGWAPRTCSKQALQYTGRSSLGTKGTVVGAPQPAQVTAVISRGAPMPVDRSRRRLALHVGQRWGSFIKPFSR